MSKAQIIAGLEVAAEIDVWEVEAHTDTIVVGPCGYEDTPSWAIQALEKNGWSYSIMHDGWIYYPQIGDK